MSEQIPLSRIEQRLLFPQAICRNWGSTVSRDALYMIIGALVVVVAGFSYYAWQQEKKPDGVEIRLDQQGLSIEGN